MSTLDRQRIHELEKRAMLLDRAAVVELVSLERKLLAVVEALDEEIDMRFQTNRIKFQALCAARKALDES